VRVLSWRKVFMPAGSAFAAGDLLKLKIVYASFTDAYSPLWTAVEEGLG
jgi:hypothetical protein